MLKALTFFIAVLAASFICPFWVALIIFTLFFIYIYS